MGSSIQPNLYLVGFMGVGKTSVGHCISKILNRPFIDSDAMIEQVAGKSVHQIFKDHGESHFRKLEADFVASGHPHCAHIISCGGGLIINPKLLKKIKEKGVVIVLSATLKTILQRIQNEPHPPLLEGVDQQKITDLFNQRLPVYKSAGPEINTESRSVESIAREVIRAYQKVLEDFNDFL